MLVLEAADTPGGGCRSDELTEPGFVHDVCSAVHPFGVASPFFDSLPLSEYGLEWIHPPAPLAHPLDRARSVIVRRSIDETADSLGSDGPAYRSLVGPTVDAWDELLPSLLGPATRIPQHPLALARFGVVGLRSAAALVRRFENDGAAGAFAGLAAHAMVPLEEPLTGAFALALGGAAHAVGWPFPRGGASALTGALVSHLELLGGTITCNHPVRTWRDLPPARTVFFDLAPRAAGALAGARVAPELRRPLRRYRHGPGVCKVDYALAEPVPWAAPETAAAGTVHVGGTFGEIAAAERAVADGRHPERPFVLAAQPSRFDPTRAPEGRHTLWAYCHVPSGSPLDCSDAIEAQLERFAPGFGDVIIGRHVRTAAAYELYDANFVGGDIGIGTQRGLRALFRPRFALDPYRIGGGLYLCSAATPPGAGVHGMCGYWAARSALRRELR